MKEEVEYMFINMLMFILKSFKKLLSFPQNLVSAGT